jgi:hypothetical protein
MKRLLTLALVSLFSFSLHAQDTLAGWTFPTGTLFDSLANHWPMSNIPASIQALGGTTVINFTTNGVSTYSAQATGWDNGMNTKYWQVWFISTGYEHIKLSGIVRSGGNNPGPRDFKIQFKVGETGSWADVPGGTVVTQANWTGGVTNNLDLPTAASNQTEIVFVRWLMSSNLDINGVDVISTGISKMDNIIVTGDQINTGIDNIIESQIQLFPNPSSGVLNISNISGGKISVFSMTGQLVATQYNSDNQTDVILDLRGLTPGVYFCRIGENNGGKILKFVLQQPKF